jgi:hypothetical protein
VGKVIPLYSSEKYRNKGGEKDADAGDPALADSGCNSLFHIVD